MHVSHLFVALTAYGLLSHSFSTSTLALWKAATLGPRTSWPRLHCTNPSRGGTKDCLCCYFGFNTLLPFFLLAPVVLLLFGPFLLSATHLAAGACLVLLGGSPGSKARPDHASGPTGINQLCRTWHRASKS